MLDHLIKLLVDNEGLACALLALVISELLPFLKGRAAPLNGIAQGLVQLLKDRAAAKKALALLPVALLAALPGCAFCRDAANAAAPRCVLEQNMIKCGESAGFSLVPLVLGLIANAVAGQPFDAGALGRDLAAQGVKDVPCVLAALLDYVSGSAPARAGDPASLLVEEQLRESLGLELARRGARGRVRLQLRAGHAVEIEIR